MALAGSVTGIYGFNTGLTPLVLKRSDIFLGTKPKAAIITCFQVNQGGGDYNTPANGIYYGYGAVAEQSGGDRQWAMGIYVEDNADPVVVDSDTVWGSSILLPQAPTGISAQMDATLVADGISLVKSGTWVGDDGDIVIEVTLIGGSDFQAYIPPTGFKTSTTTQGGIPFLPNLAMYGQDIGNSAVGVLNQGFVFDNGVDTATQYSRRFNYRAFSGGDASVGFYNDSFSNTGTKMTHTDFDADGGNFEHNFTSTGSLVNFSWAALYMRFDDEDVSLVDITLPQSTGTFTKADYGFNPAITKVWGNGAAETWNSLTFYEIGGGNLFDWTIEGSGNTVAAYLEHNGDPSNADTRMALGALQSIGDTGSLSYEGAAAQRIDGGFSAEFDSVSAVDFKSFSLALGTSSGGGLNISLGDTPASTLYLGDTQVAGAYLGAVSLGGAGGEWSTQYSDVEPADDSGDWSSTASTLTAESGGLQYTQTTTGFATSSFSKTSVVGKDYRITFEVGTVVGDVTLAVFGGPSVIISPNLTLSSDETFVFTCKAVGTTITPTLVSGVPGSACLVKSILIEVM